MTEKVRSTDKMRLNPEPLKVVPDETRKAWTRIGWPDCKVDWLAADGDIHICERPQDHDGRHWCGCGSWRNSTEGRDREER